MPDEIVGGGKWVLRGTAAQNAILRPVFQPGSLSFIAFPWAKITALPHFPVSITWQDLNSGTLGETALRAAWLRSSTKGVGVEDHRESLHDHVVDEDGNEGHAIRRPALDGRLMIAGVFWSDGRVKLDVTLEAHVAREVLSAEIAHAVDYGLPMTDGQKTLLMTLFHPGGADAHTWWQRQDYGAEYYTLVGECVDEETECLSQRLGWTKSSELREGDYILGFDIENEGLRWAHVDRVHRHEAMPYRVWSNRNFECAVTDNHRWLVRDAQRHFILSEGRSPGRPSNGSAPRREPQTRPSIDVASLYAPHRLVETMNLTGGLAVPLAARSLEQPSQPIYEDDFVELVAWSLTEGYYKPSRSKNPQRALPMPGMPPGAGSVVVAQKHYRQRVATLMARLGVAKGSPLANSGVHYWTVSGDLARRVKEVAPGKAPGVEFFRQLTYRQLRLFVEVCLLGDGNTADQSGRDERRTFFQQPGPRLDSFLTACVLSGLPVHRNGSVDGCERWTMRRTSIIGVHGLETGPYIVAPTWCPQTSLGTFVARRNGSIFITGNSWMALFTHAYSSMIPWQEPFVHKATKAMAPSVYAILGISPVGSAPPPPPPAPPGGDDPVAIQRPIYVIQKTELGFDINLNSKWAHQNRTFRFSKVRCMVQDIGTKRGAIAVRVFSDQAPNGTALDPPVVFGLFVMDEGSEEQQIGNDPSDGYTLPPNQYIKAETTWSGDAGEGTTKLIDVAFPDAVQLPTP